MLGGGGAGLEVGRPKPKPRLSGFLRSYGNVSFKVQILPLIFPFNGKNKLYYICERKMIFMDVQIELFIKPP